MSKNRDTMRYVGLGSQMMAMLLVAVWGGWKLDSIVGWRFPVFLLSFPLLALGISLYKLIKEISKPKE